MIISEKQIHVLLQIAKFAVTVSESQDTKSYIRKFLATIERQQSDELKDISDE